MSSTVVELVPRPSKRPWDVGALIQRACGRLPVAAQGPWLPYGQLLLAEKSLVHIRRGKGTRSGNNIVRCDNSANTRVVQRAECLVVPDCIGVERVAREARLFPNPFKILYFGIIAEFSERT